MTSPRYLPIDASLRARWTRADLGWRAEVPTGWAQGRSVFGGLTAALIAALGRRHVGPERVLRSLSLALVLPVRPGPVEGSAHTVREGKGVVFVEVKLAQDEREVATATLCFVTPRAGSIAIAAPPPPALPSPEAATDLPYIEGVTPEFVRNVQMRWARGAPPFSRATEASFAGHCRFRGRAGDAEGLLALLDVWPSPSLSLLAAPTFASTVTWSAHLVRAPDDFDGWFTFEYETVAGADGFHTVVGRLFGPDGELAAWTEQLMALFD